MNGITFIEQDCRVGFMRRNDTRESLLKVLKRLNCTSAGITYIFCSDEYLLEINRNYLNHDTLTDVITFDYTLSGQEFPGEEILKSFLFSDSETSKEKSQISNSDKGKENSVKTSTGRGSCLCSSGQQKKVSGNRAPNFRPVSGDIYISIDRIKENAKMFHVKHIDELNRVMVHGLLHLAGYEDKTPEKEKAIHEKEDEMLATCFSGYGSLLKAKRK